MSGSLRLAGSRRPRQRSRRDRDIRQAGNGVLLLLGLVVDAPTPVDEAVALAAASVLGRVGRFLVMRYRVLGTNDAPVQPVAAKAGTVDAWDERA
jgi:hypothetical protein